MHKGDRARVRDGKRETVENSEQKQHWKHTLSHWWGFVNAYLHVGSYFRLDEWLLGCCTYAAYFSLVREHCAGLDSSDACYNYSNQTQQSKEKQPFLFFFTVYCIFFYLINVYIYPHKMRSNCLNEGLWVCFAMRLLFTQIENCQQNNHKLRKKRLFYHLFWNF